MLESQLNPNQKKFPTSFLVVELWLWHEQVRRDQSCERISTDGEEFRKIRNADHDGGSNRSDVASLDDEETPQQDPNNMKIGRSLQISTTRIPEIVVESLPLQAVPGDPAPSTESEHAKHSPRAAGAQLRRHF